MKLCGGYRGIDVGVESCFILEFDYLFVLYMVDVYCLVGLM